ncbi:RNA-binding protein YlmH, contains S4-like domain [Amphibacillus marinus]|uniref:RNA-binding protein YlmH, contains S4-like domain n=1 Tax=Amphibacillus marinus TaxID=872970 RepID=A0A1H8I206_9BACI|nr:YlmH/Sll1252 family protein [Amphibacillus marinus]SEN62372.1 RNA-binding protein YlmH, contains S4-like domain [Amphibacillus marinus]
MDIYQHFRKEERHFVDQVVSWRDQVNQFYTAKISDFLDPREQFIFQSVIGQDEQLNLSFSGGYQGAERKQAALAPYYEELTDNDFPITLLMATYSTRFNQIEHRDVLGAFFSLGMKHKKLGDINVDAEQGLIQLAVSHDVADFVSLHFTQIKQTSIQFKKIEQERALSVAALWRYHETTVSSLRLDVLVKHVYRISRSQAAQLIGKGYLKVNFKVVEDPAFKVEAGDLLSCRGKGRSKLISILGETKKEKWRIEYGILEK